MKAQKILVIDDDEDIVDILSLIFREEGYHVVSSTTAIPAEDLKAIRPSLVLLDVRISGSEKSGVDICREIKNSDLGSTLPVILISAENDISSIAKQCGADSFIGKPFDIHGLLSTVRELLS